MVIPNTSIHAWVIQSKSKKKTDSKDAAGGSEAAGARGLVVLSISSAGVHAVDGYSSWCSICHEGGDVLLCDEEGCGAMQHAACSMQSDSERDTGVVTTVG